jgi:hypothetical protein
VQVKAAIAAALLASLGGCTAVKGGELGWPRAGGDGASSEGHAPGGASATTPTSSHAAERVRTEGGSWPDGVPDYDSAEKVAGLRDMGGGVWWLNMPVAARKADGWDGCPELQFEDYDQWHLWHPYEDDTRPILPEILDLTVDQALAALTKTDEQLCIVLRTDSFDDCTTPGGAGHICRAEPHDRDPVDTSGIVTMWLQYDVRPADGDHRLEDVTARPTDDVVADLARRGFTSVTVTEAEVPCDPGIVCEMFPRPNYFYPADEPITLRVRKRRK